MSVAIWLFDSDATATPVRQVAESGTTRDLAFRWHMSMDRARSTLDLMARCGVAERRELVLCPHTRRRTRMWWVYR